MSAGMSAGGATSAAADLRVALDTLLGEHALLAIAATQKGYDGDPDFDLGAPATRSPMAQHPEMFGG